MNKLQRYEIQSDYGLEISPVSDKPRPWDTYCKSKDVAALEAENERLREAIKTALVDIAELEVILNREQEKQQ